MVVLCIILSIIIIINLYTSTNNREYYQQVPLNQYQKEQGINIFSDSNSPQDTYQKFNMELTSSLANVNKAQSMLGIH
jgi:hypothetical protein